MSPLRHRLLLASAGTGKTFRLTHHLIDLLLRGEDPGRILASTFTRKAAGEILDRVLGRLIEGSTDPDKLVDLNRHLAHGDVSAEQCLGLLAGLVLRLDRFQVRTLDAFFVHIGHLFAFDLGLPAGWNIADTHQENSLIDEAIGRVIEDLPAEQLLELLRGVSQGETTQRSVRAAMRRVIENARSCFLESEPGAWELVVVPDGLKEATLTTLTGFVESMELPVTGKGTPAKHWVSAHARIVRDLESGNWKDFLDVTLVQKVIAGEERYSSKTIEDDVREALQMLARQAAHVLIAEIADRNRATVELLTRFQVILDEVKRKRGLLTFDDLPRALAPAGGIGLSALAERDLDLDFRLDARIDHLLLDEFQDTAPVQWRILERTAEEILSEHTGERTFFCVGDVKQSIYGFRAAEPRLLGDLGDWYSGQIEIESLADNYRSSEVVLDAVNQVFGNLRASGIFDDDDKAPFRDAAEEWQRGFKAHVAKLDLPGDVVVLQASAPDKEGGEDDWNPVIELVTRRVKSIAASAPGATIGVLFRSNKPIPRLIERLLTAGLRASGEGGNPLTDSRAVLHLLSALHLADHPGDSVAAFHFAMSPLSTAIQSLTTDALDSPVVVARFLRSRLLWESLGDFCSRLIRAVDDADEYGDWDRRRFRQLVDLAYTHGSAVGLRLTNFVELVREQRVEDPSSSGIKVMTVHASKGLEFDAVLLPELDASLIPRPTGVLSRRPDPRRRFDMCTLTPISDLVPLAPQLKELYDGEKQRGMEEALCVLYVAMTRARHRLEMFVRAKTSKTTCARLLRDQLGTGEPDDDGVIWRHPDGVDDWFVPQAAGDEAAPAPEPVALALAPSKRPRERPRLVPSAAEGEAESRGLYGRALLSRPSRAGAAHGSLIHRWMEEIEWLEDFDRGDEDLLELAAKIEPDLQARSSALTVFREYLAKPGVRETLSRSASSTSCRVWRERNFSVLLPDGDGNEILCSGALDRVVLKLEGDKVVRAALLDYKTDAVEGAELSASVEEYRPQLESYRQALAAITGLAPSAIEASLLYLHTGEHVTL